MVENFTYVEKKRLPKEKACTGVSCWSETPLQMFSWEICKIFKDTFIVEHLQMTAS